MSPDEQVNRRKALKLLGLGAGVIPAAGEIVRAAERPKLVPHNYTRENFGCRVSTARCPETFVQQITVDMLYGVVVQAV